jgi:DNA modification methylase
MEKIICLGKEFNSEEERREYYRSELRTKLPELKKIEGFPIGEDEDIINLSDPPFYTACPNPWLNDFIAEWEKEKENIKGRKKDFHVEGPLASDVIVGKNHPIYNAHSYHTKVPHQAIMRYILHFTEPGDIVFDGFGGTGMTGIAAKMCGNPEEDAKYSIENEFKNIGLKPPLWGLRNAIQGDISTISSFIGYNFSTNNNVDSFLKIANEIYDQLYNEYSWTYKTKYLDNIYDVHYFIWSEFQNCENCGKDFSYWNSAIDFEKATVLDDYYCPYCKVLINKRTSKKAFKTDFDILTNETVRKAYFKIEKINISYKGKRIEINPSEFDDALIEKINNTQIDEWVPTNKLPVGDKTGDPFRLGVNRVHEFYTKRNLLILSKFYSLIDSYQGDNRIKKHLLIWFTSCQSRLHNMNRYSVQHERHVGPMANTLYISANPTEISPFYFIKSKLNENAINIKGKNTVVNQVRSALESGLINDSIDFIFTDPPFGANIMYSELNIINESWLKILTNNKSEAIQNKTQGKTIDVYQELMLKSFLEFYRILKPNKWIVVEFSNTSAAVWNAIQTSLQRAGFILASVHALNKGRGGLQAIIGPTAVSQDLIISCYKPSTLIAKLIIEDSNSEFIWEFILDHLNHLPIYIKIADKTSPIIERSPRVLYDRLITYYLLRGIPVPIDARDFQEGLRQRFIERDGMYFTAEQAAEYDEKKAKSPNFVQLSLIVTNESDAIEWLKERLRKKAQKYQDIMPDFRIATQSLRKGDTLPELQDILNESFIQEADGKWRTPDPNEAKDREALRSKVLLKEFAAYVTAMNLPKAKKLKEVRVEALRAGFKSSWEQKDFKTIVILGDMIPQNILLEDEQLLMYYDIAKDRI